MRNINYDGTPTECFGITFKNLLPVKEWDKIRREVYKREKHTCEFCKRNCFEHNFPIHAHEKWEYKHNSGTRKLVKIMAACPQCHAIQHIGRQKILYNNNQISIKEFIQNFRHYSFVNKIEFEQAIMDYFEFTKEDILACPSMEWKHKLGEYNKYEQMMDEAITQKESE